MRHGARACALRRALGEAAAGRTPPLRQHRSPRGRAADGCTCACDTRRAVSSPPQRRACVPTQRAHRAGAERGAWSGKRAASCGCRKRVQTGPRADVPATTTGSKVAREQRRGGTKHAPLTAHGGAQQPRRGGRRDQRRRARPGGRLPPASARAAPRARRARSCARRLRRLRRRRAARPPSRDRSASAGSRALLTATRRRAGDGCAVHCAATRARLREQRCSAQRARTSGGSSLTDRARRWHRSALGSGCRVHVQRRAFNERGARSRRAANAPAQQLQALLQACAPPAALPACGRSTRRLWTTQGTVRTRHRGLRRLGRACAHTGGELAASGPSAASPRRMASGAWFPSAHPCACFAAARRRCAHCPVASRAGIAAPGTIGTPR